MDGLIGHSGFVGSHLKSQHTFNRMFNRTNADQIVGPDFETLVCAAAPGSMFEANRFPATDEARIDALIDLLSRVSARNFILVSSIAVLRDFAGQDDETTTSFQEELAYGKHRRKLEVFCQARFENCLIVRLPALFGQGLKKNFVFDLMNPIPSMLTEARMTEIVAVLSKEQSVALRDTFEWSDHLQMYVVNRKLLAGSGYRTTLETALAERGFSATGFTNPHTTFQFYNLANLWRDIDLARSAGLSIIHLATEPVTANTVHEHLIGSAMPLTSARLHSEDMHTAHADIWDRSGPYLADQCTVLEGLTDFFRNERGLA